jgi:hypothetical protein
MTDKPLSTVIARVVAPVKQPETAGTAGRFRLGRGLAYSFEIDVVRYKQCQERRVYRC